MKFQSIKLREFTVFENCDIGFSQGINVFIGENATGKTHLLKLLYSAAQASRHDVSFSRKIVGAMQPDKLCIYRLLSRTRENNTASVAVQALNSAGTARRLQVSFSRHTKKWDAKVTGEETWEKDFGGKSSIFIPVREILSNCYNLPAAVNAGNIRFDDTYVDIINSAKINISVGRDSAAKVRLLTELEKLTHGKVTYDAQTDEFYLRVGNSRQEFNLIAEGIRKLALLWQLVKNGTLETGSVLFWDEPEANLNPSCIPVVAAFLSALQKTGVQIFLATHDYMLSKYLELYCRDQDSLLFHSLSSGQEEQSAVRYVQCSSSPTFGGLEHNAILDSFNSLLDEIYKQP